MNSNLENSTQPSTSEFNEENQLDDFIKKYIKNELEAKKFKVNF